MPGWSTAASGRKGEWERREKHSAFGELRRPSASKRQVIRWGKAHAAWYNMTNAAAETMQVDPVA